MTETAHGRNVTINITVPREDAGMDANASRRSDRPEPREVISARFPPHVATAARRAAAAEGKHVSEWLSELAGMEIARRENRCPTCGQDLASAETNGEPR